MSQILYASSPGRLHFVLWRLKFVDPQSVSYLLPSVASKFQVAPRYIENMCTSGVHTFSEFVTLSSVYRIGLDFQLQQLQNQRNKATHTIQLNNTHRPRHVH